MGAPKFYGQMNVTVDGILSLDTSDCEVENVNKDQDVETLAGGWRGITISPDMTKAKVDGFIQASGFEIDFEDREQKRKVVTIAFVMLGSGKTRTSRGFVRNVAIKSGVGKNSSVSFDFLGEPSKFQ